MSAPPSGPLLLPSADFVQLQQALLDAGAELREVSLAGVRNKGALLARFATALDFPEGIGHNWDSLADALTDLAWSAHVPCHALLLKDCHSLQDEAPEDFQTLLEILGENLDYWQAQGIALQIAMEAAARQPTA